MQFLGANRQVTGSKYFLDTGSARILIDCGMFQERSFLNRNWDRFPIDVSSIDAVVLSHAHIDHCGLLPRLCGYGCQAPIFATPPTVDLSDVMLRDAAKIQMEDVKYKQKRHAREGRKSQFAYEPLYDEQQAAATIQRFQAVNYFTEHEIAQGVTAKFYDAGHILGSASIELSCTPGGDRPITRIVFSGDIGQWDKPIIRDPTLIAEADFLIIESTYGDRLHESSQHVETQIEDVVKHSLSLGGKLIIPTFAVERAQELLFYFARLVRDRRMPDVPVFLDSPMAADVTRLFEKHYAAYDAEMWRVISGGDKPLSFANLVFARTTDDSKAINDVAGPAVIMATSGMCTAGRIKHHLRRHLGDPNSTILFVGYQGEGTLGREILDRKPEVRIHGRNYPVKANVARIYGFSGHADRDGLLRWRSGFKQPPRRTFVTHGEEQTALNFAKTLSESGWDVHVPQYQESVTLES